MSVIAERDGHTLLPSGDGHSCFGCSPSNPFGMHMRFYISKDGDSVSSWYSVPDHLCGWGGVVHGGIVSTMLDEAMGWACISILRRFLLSKSMKVDFVKPVLVGKPIRVVGSVQKRSSDREATMQGLVYDDAGEICAKASSTVALFTLDAVRKMGVIDEGKISYFEKLWNEAEIR